MRQITVGPIALSFLLALASVGRTAESPKDYLEKGKPVNAAVWRRAQGVFGGDFFGFAVWFN